MQRDCDYLQKRFEFILMAFIHGSHMQISSCETSSATIRKEGLKWHTRHSLVNTKYAGSFFPHPPRKIQQLKYDALAASETIDFHVKSP